MSNHLTVVCPEPILTGGRVLAALFGAVPQADLHSFQSLNWTNGTTLYGVHACDISDSLAATIRYAKANGLQLQRPAWDAGPDYLLDMEAGQDAINGATILDGTEDETPIGDGMVIALNVGPDATLALAGLTPTTSNQAD